MNHHWMIFMDMKWYSYPLRIHGAGILMLTWLGYMDGIHVTIYSSTMDPSWDIGYGQNWGVSPNGHDWCEDLLSRSMLDTYGTTYDIRDSKVSKIVEISKAWKLHKTCTNTYRIYTHTYVYIYICTHTHLYIYMYIYIRIYIYIHMYFNLYTRMYMFTYTYVYVYIQYIYIYICICTCIYRDTCIYMCIYIHTCICTYIYIYIYIHMYIYIYMCIDISYVIYTKIHMEIMYQVSGPWFQWRSLGIPIQGVHCHPQAGAEIWTHRRGWLWMVVGAE